MSAYGGYESALRQQQQESENGGRTSPRAMPDLRQRGTSATRAPQLGRVADESMSPSRLRTQILSRPQLSSPTATTTSLASSVRPTLSHLNRRSSGFEARDLGSPTAGPWSTQRDSTPTPREPMPTSPSIASLRWYEDCSSPTQYGGSPARGGGSPTKPRCLLPPPRLSDASMRTPEARLSRSRSQTPPPAAWPLSPRPLSPRTSPQTPGNITTPQALTPARSQFFQDAPSRSSSKEPSRGGYPVPTTPQSQPHFPLTPRTPASQQVAKEAQARAPSRESRRLLTAREEHQQKNGLSKESSSGGSQQALAEGVVIRVSGRSFRICEPLGSGSFGVVWAAEDVDCGTRVAIKEIPCRSQNEVTKVTAEARTLKLVETELEAAGLRSALGHIPVLVASAVEPLTREKSRVILAMSLVPGEQVETFFTTWRESGHARVPARAFADACRYASALLVQLTPVVEGFSSCTYHRDITPRNILIQEFTNGEEPHFSLVDFGLAVDAKRWRQGAGYGDLGGDGRYWPTSAWFAFCFGRETLEKEPVLGEEYRMRLDMHSLGLSALRCFVEMLPSMTEALAAGYPENVVHALRALRSAWQRLWHDSCRFWQKIFEAFCGRGEFESIRDSYIKMGVPQVISEDLCDLRAAMVQARSASQTSLAEFGLSVAFFSALLDMVQTGQQPSRKQSKEPANDSASLSTASPNSTSPLASGGTIDERDGFETTTHTFFEPMPRGAATMGTPRGATTPRATTPRPTTPRATTPGRSPVASRSRLMPPTQCWGTMAESWTNRRSLSPRQVPGH